MKSLGRFHLMGIPPAPRGMPQVEVAFDIDANGIVNVSAKDLATGKEQAMTITGGTSLSKDEIDRMVGDAEKFAAEDHARREAAEARNTADQLHYQVAKFLEDNAETIPAADKDELVEKNDELKKVLDDEVVRRRRAHRRERRGDAGVPAGRAGDGPEPAGVGRRRRADRRRHRGRRRDRQSPRATTTSSRARSSRKEVRRDAHQMGSVP